MESHMDRHEMAARRAWLDRWRRTGLALEEQRTQDLGRLDDETARQVTRELFARWRPDEVEPHQSGLVEQQRLFRLVALGREVAGR